MDGLLKKLFGVSPYFIITFPIAVIFGLCVAWFLILSNTTEGLLESDNPLKRAAGWTLVCIFGLDYFIWVSTKVPYQPLHDNYPMIFFIAVSTVLSLVLIGAIFLALYLIVDSYWEGVKLEHRVYHFLGMDKHGNDYKLGDDIEANKAKSDAEKEELEKRNQAAHASMDKLVAKEREAGYYASRMFREVYDESSLRDQIWMDENRDDVREKYIREWDCTEEYRQWSREYDRKLKGTPEPAPVVKKPRKPRVKKVAPPVVENPQAVTNSWLAERNAKEALRRNT